jgi:hypothetical protein
MAIGSFSNWHHRRTIVCNHLVSHHLISHHRIVRARVGRKQMSLHWRAFFPPRPCLYVTCTVYVIHCRNANRILLLIWFERSVSSQYPGAKKFDF